MKEQKTLFKYYFFIGTEAELIKMTPVMRIFDSKNISYGIISSGQNSIARSIMLHYLKQKISIFLTKKPVYQNAFGLSKWFIFTLIRGIFIFRKEFKYKQNKKTWLIIHGDTLSTVMGAVIGRFYNFKIAHVEAGYKSNNFINPFPEEIDRFIASGLSDILFCPLKSIGFNKSKQNNIIDTGYNTSIDSLYLPDKRKNISQFAKSLKGTKYFIFAIHRQETLLNKKLLIGLIRYLSSLQTKLFCVFTLHKPTEKALTDLKLIKSIKNNKKIIIVKRLQFFDYRLLLRNCEYILTDGVGNQQETYYLGKPCLILRSITEGREGLNHNAKLSFHNLINIKHFIHSYKSYVRKPVKFTVSPSKIIAEYLIEN